MNPIRLPLRTALVAIATLVTLRAEFIPFQDDFKTLSRGNWTASAYGAGCPDPRVADGLFIADTGPSANAHALARSTRSDFNPFENGLSIKVDVASFEGTPKPGRNVAFILLGRTQASSVGGKGGTPNYYPGTSSDDNRGTIALSIWQTETGKFSLTLQEQVAGVFDRAKGQLPITNSPTAIEWNLTVNSENLLAWSVVLTGAEFTQTGSASMSGSFSKAVTSSVLKDAHLALGAWNNYDKVTAASVLKIDNVKVTEIPKPKTR